MFSRKEIARPRTAEVIEGEGLFKRVSLKFVPFNPELLELLEVPFQHHDAMLTMQFKCQTIDTRSKIDETPQ